ncbi:hypothetical protein ACET3X_003321 [Alternaria dauci]|uniref:Uncharacterized protein n=1 Tax=Alternaria dauci TaxID=48095 RepID=A0ABR3USI0_9PLEO
MMSVAGADAIAQGSVTWQTTILNLADPAATTGFTLVPLQINGVNFTTVTVQFPISSGVIYGKEPESVVKPGDVKVVEETLTLSYATAPPQIWFQSALPTLGPTSSSTLPPATGAAVSTTSSLSQGLTTIPPSVSAASGSAALPSASKVGNAATREIALRFVIAWVVVSKIQPSKDPSKSLLPSEVAHCYQAISAGDRGYQGQISLMARWRVMTAELMQSSYVRNPFSPSDSRHASIQATLATLDNVLQPYADTRMNNEERKRNLEELLKRAALFAFTLFSQPSAWEFEWQEEQGVTSGELCIFPALVQVADEAGHPVNPPRPFSEAVVRRLDA